MDKDTIYLTGKNNTAENKVLYDWVKLSKRVCEKSIFLLVLVVLMKIFPGI